jgi:hypothetical protein
MQTVILPLTPSRPAVHGTSVPGLRQNVGERAESGSGDHLGAINFGPPHCVRIFDMKKRYSL